jgi:hypothetical protein
MTQEGYGPGADAVTHRAHPHAPDGEPRILDMRLNLKTLPPAMRTSMLAAGNEIRECYWVMEKADLNIVGEVLRGQDTFVEMDHFPPDDVFDPETFSQYYYHAHRGSDVEHGHFHTFLRSGGMPAGSASVDYSSATVPWPRGDNAICHLIAISMDAWGYPVGIFCTNRWVTDETWYPSQQVIAMLDRFIIDHAYPNWCVNRWLSAMLRLYRPHIEALVHERDKVVAERQAQDPGRDVFENRGLEIICYLPISVEQLMTELVGLDGSPHHPG